MDCSILSEIFVVCRVRNSVDISAKDTETTKGRVSPRSKNISNGSPLERDSQIIDKITKVDITSKQSRVQICIEKDESSSSSESDDHSSDMDIEPSFQKVKRNKREREPTADENSLHQT